MKVIFTCPQCEAPSQADVSQARDWHCANCEQALHLNQGEPTLPACLVCGNHELYKKKDFPHGLGMVILVAACAASFVTIYWYQWWLTWSILIGTAVFDGLLYLWVGDVFVCYRCNAHHKNFPAGSAHEPHEITIGERYRQERLRREQLKTGR